MNGVHLKWHGHFKKSRRFKNFLCFQLVNVKSVETSERSTKEVSFGFSRWLWLPPSVFTKQLHSSSWRQRCFSCQCQTEKKLWTNQADIFKSQLSTRERNLCHKCNRKEDKASSAPSTSRLSRLLPGELYLSNRTQTMFLDAFSSCSAMSGYSVWESSTSQTSTRQEGLLPQNKMCVWDEYVPLNTSDHEVVTLLAHLASMQCCTQKAEWWCSKNLCRSESGL